MKRILVPNGNYTDIRLIQELKKLGLYVITSGNNPLLEGHKYADEYVCHDYSDKEGMLELAKVLKLDYISACSNDFGVTTAAYIAEKLGLPGHDTYEAATIIAEKDKFKKFALANSLKVIPSAYFDNKIDALEYAKKQEYPIIVKPTDLGGGKGVTKVDSVADVKQAIDIAISASKAKHIVIEPFIVGTQHSFTTFLVNKKVKVYTSFNEFDSKYNPFLVGYTTSPADNMNKHAPVLIEQIEKIAKLLNLVDGIFHVQYRVYKDEPLIMECMRRCLGNYALKTASDLSGFSWEEWIAKSYCGIDCSHIPITSDVGKWISHYYIQAPKNGHVKAVEIDEITKKYIYDSIMQWEKSQEITEFKKEMLGFVFMKFPNEEIRNRVANKLNENIRIIMED